MSTSVPRRVTSSDGVAIAVHEYGDPASPTIVAVHGYPDNHAVWDGAAALLAQRFHVVAYDVRGCGESDKPGVVSSYRMSQLVDDLLAVVDVVSPDAPVHLLAHDWGSIQSWAALLDPRTSGRIVSYTSISGPSLDYSGAWIRDLRKHPRATLGQLAHSYYVGLFQVPGLPEMAIRSGLLGRLMALGARGTRSSAAVDGEPPRSEADMINGLSLYRANMASLAKPSPVRTSVPVQVIVPAGDSYVTPAMAAGAPKPWVDELTVHTIAGGHWVVSERPDVIAGLVTEFLDNLDAPVPPAKTRPGRFGGKLVVVTGGARGIGRSTALQFARNGADVLIADIDDVAAKQTASELRETGVGAWSEHLDVADADAWTDFATKVREEHGVADVLVNNAGIGMGGTFLGTTTADWKKVLGVNVWSVIHGSRLFAVQMIERGQGGHIANVASAAAFSPSIVYPAYATSKAAVLMLTECLRAELRCEGIGVTAVCPGFIDTDISATTIHVGVDEATARQRREHQVASYRRRGYGPDKVARQLLDAVAADKPLAVITPEAKFFRAVSRFAPGLGRRIATLDLNKI